MRLGTAGCWKYTIRGQRGGGRGDWEIGKLWNWEVGKIGKLGNWEIGKLGN